MHLWQCRKEWCSRAGARLRGRSLNLRGAYRLAVLLAMPAAVAIATAGQQPLPPGAPIPQRQPLILTTGGNRLPDPNAQKAMSDQQAKQKSYAAVNVERKKQIADDSAHLLKLAIDLKAEVDKTTKDTLSLTVIRKADEIERLAHSVKEKMKLTVGTN